MKDQRALIPEGQIEWSILMIRGQKVIMDSHLTILYGVETRRLNEQVKRNSDRFPEDFMFRLSAAEFENLKSHFATSSTGWGGRPFRNNLSMTSTRNHNVSLFCHFMDMFSECGHDADMNEQAYATTKLDAAITANLKELGYDG